MSITESPKTIRIYSELVLSAVAFSFTGPLLRFSSDAGTEFWPTLLIRSLFTAGCLRFVAGQPLRWSKQSIAAATLLNLQFLAFAMAVLFVNPGMVSLLSYTSLIWVPIIAAFTAGGRISLRSIVTSVGLLFSSAFFFLDQLSFHEHIGLQLGLAAGFIWSITLIFIAKGEQSGCPALMVFIQASILLAVLAGVAMLSDRAHLSTSGLGWAAAGGIQASAALLLLIRPMRYLNATVVNIGLFSFDPTLASLWSILFFNSRPDKWALFGGSSLITILLLNAMLALLDKRATEAKLESITS